MNISGTTFAFTIGAAFGAGLCLDYGLAQYLNGRKAAGLLNIAFGGIALAASAYLVYLKYIEEMEYNERCKIYGSTVESFFEIQSACRDALKKGLTLLNNTKIPAINVNHQMELGSSNSIPACFVLENGEGNLKQLGLIGQVAKAYLYDGCFYLINFVQKK